VSLAAGDRGDHMDERAGLERRVEPRPLTIDVDVNVLPDIPAARVAQPVSQTRPLRVELTDRVVDRRRIEVEAAREPRKERHQRWRQVDVGHQSTIATSTDEIAGR